MSTSRSRRYPSVAAGAVTHPEYKATVTNAGATADVITALFQGARKITVTGVGADGTTWTFTHKGRSVDYAVSGSPSATTVAAALVALINARWPGELKSSNVAGVIRMVVLDRSDEVPALVNSGAGTATNVAGIKYANASSDTATVMASGLCDEAALFPDLSASDNVGADVHLKSASDIPGAAPTISGSGGITVGAVTAVSASDTNGFGLQTVRQS